MPPRWMPLAALSVLLLAGCGSGKTVTVTSTAAAPVASASSTNTTSSSPTTAASSTTTTASPAATSPTAPVVHLGTFRSPSANIGCTLVAGLARCDIRQRSWSPPPRPPGCPSQVDFGQGLMVGGGDNGVGRFVCAGDTSLDPSAPVLAYGTDSLSGGFRCESRSAGVTCTQQTTGHGFFISAGSYRVF